LSVLPAIADEVISVRRREFIAGLAGASAWPAVARAQRQAAMPVVGILSSASTDGPQAVAVVRGLADTGYVEGRNVAIERKSARDQYDRLPMLAADLVQRRVAVIVAIGSVRAPLAAKAATATIPIVFGFGSDPVELGLVDSLSRPGGNITGVTLISRELLVKRLDLLHKLVPGAVTVGVLVNPDNPNTAPSVAEMEALARVKGWVLNVVEARTVSDLDGAFETLARRQTGVLLHATDAFFTSQGGRIVALAARYAIPAIYTSRETVLEGGLMCYGANIPDQYRNVGIYAGRILKGEKPAELPVLQPTKFDFVINLKTAKALGLTIPETLLATADEVIQ
jgi:putative tryptophan/tyrosine transport system substrate-binding protein